MLRGRAVRPDSLWFATTEPAYADRTNATVLHAVLRLDRAVSAYDATGSVRSALAVLRAAWQGPGDSLVVTSDTRTGRPGGSDEAAGGDAAAALLVGDGARVLAEIVAWESVTDEFLDRWRTPGAPAARLWEARTSVSDSSISSPNPPCACGPHPMIRVGPLPMSTGRLVTRVPADSRRSVSGP